MGNEHLSLPQALIVALLPVLTVVSMALLIATAPFDTSSGLSAGSAQGRPGQEQKPAVTHVTTVAGMPIL